MVHPEIRRRIRGGPRIQYGAGYGGRAGPVPNPTTPIGRWCALTRPPPSCWPRSGNRYPPNRDDRGGTRNIFLTCEPLAGWRHVAITERRTMQDFAHQMQWLVNVAHPDATVVRVVLDNLNTHRRASLYETFPAAEARRIAKRLEFHHTPKHASWLNMAEIEFSALSRSCLKRRNPDADALQRPITAYETQRNVTGVTINWRFSTNDARTKLQRFYPCLSNID